jgi:hypothetical protein
MFLKFKVILVQVAFYGAVLTCIRLPKKRGIGEPQVFWLHVHPVTNKKHDMSGDVHNKIRLN